jgi:hypothetical protein
MGASDGGHHEREPDVAAHHTDRRVAVVAAPAMALLLTIDGGGSDADLKGDQGGTGHSHERREGDNDTQQDRATQRSKPKNTSVITNQEIK